jgi:6-phosphogluconate dehydrogenase
VIRIGLADRALIGQEFFRWEIATAVAGAIIGIDPFDQPDVEAAKVKTRVLVEQYESTGKLDRREPVLGDGQLSFYASKEAATATALLKLLFAELTPGGYFGILAYVERNAAHEAALSAMRTAVRDSRRVATVAGFGPRFLHSTGQAYKGGPAGGVFLEIARNPQPDLAIPGHRASFGTVQLAQALGDLDVLANRGRPWLRIHIEGDVDAGLDAIRRLVVESLASPLKGSLMRIGIIGLGRMGGSIARRLMRAGHQTVVWDRDAAAIASLVADGATAASSLADMAGQLGSDAIFWVMLPAGDPTETTIEQLAALAARGATIIDGGNSFYKDDIRRAKSLAPRGVDYVDVGTSGGVWGLERGFCMMIGGREEIVRKLDPIFEALAPGIGDIARTPGRDRPDDRAERGYMHAGPPGAGHFVKMVHNGIEYGLMQAYAEGFDILKGKASETLPEEERFTIDLPDVAEVWRRGSVVSSWLLDLTAAALARDKDLEAFSGSVADSGEGRWTIDAAMEEAVPAYVMSAALYARYRSRVASTFGDKLLSAMRFGFGGHIERPR